MDNNKPIEELYEEYLEGNATLKSEYDSTLAKVSSKMDEKLAKGTLTSEDFADYEESAVHAGFYAGYRAALAAMNV
jgi:hypothetical protein